MTLPRKYMVEREVCGTCVHYWQHYVLHKGQFRPLWYGHCAQPWRRHPSPEEVCPRWEGDEQEPVSRS